MESLDSPCSTTQLCAVVEKFGTGSSTYTASSPTVMAREEQCETPSKEEDQFHVMGEFLGGSGRE